jgi:hypothetical protein
MPLSLPLVVSFGTFSCLAVKEKALLPIDRLQDCGSFVYNLRKKR